MKANPDDPRYRASLHRNGVILAQAYLAEQRHAEAATLALRVAKVAPSDLRGACDGYTLLVRCIPVAAVDRELSESARKTVAQKYTEQARALLRKGARSGKDPTAALNDLAWFLTTNPNRVVRDPVLAVEFAQEATRRAPDRAALWNTLGVAHYRAGAWKEARAALEISMQLGEGGSGGIGCSWP